MSRWRFAANKFPSEAGVCLEVANSGQFYILTVTKTDRWKKESLNSGIECEFVCVLTHSSASHILCSGRFTSSTFNH